LEVSENVTQRVAFNKCLDDESMCDIANTLSAEDVSNIVSFACFATRSTTIHPARIITFNIAAV